MVHMPHEPSAKHPSEPHSPSVQPWHVLSRHTGVVPLQAACSVAVHSTQVPKALTLTSLMLTSHTCLLPEQSLLSMHLPLRSQLSRKSSGQ